MIFFFLRGQKGHISLGISDLWYKVRELFQFNRDLQKLYYLVINNKNSGCFVSSSSLPRLQKPLHSKVTGRHSILYSCTEFIVSLSICWSIPRQLFSRKSSLVMTVHRNYDPILQACWNKSMTHDYPISGMLNFNWTGNDISSNILMTSFCCTENNLKILEGLCIFQYNLKLILG